MASQSEVRLTIGEERVTTADVTKGESVDLKNRDPENLHDGMKVCLFNNECLLTHFNVHIPLDRCTLADIFILLSWCSWNRRQMI